MDVAITFPNGQCRFIKLDNFSANLNGNLEKGLQSAGRFLEAQMKRRLKKGRSAGVHQELRSDTGQLRASITVDPQRGAKKVADGYQVKIGPNKVYAAIHEFGGQIRVTPRMRMFLGMNKGWWLKRTTSHIKTPARPYVGPTLSENLEGVAKIISNRIYGPLQ
jgi:phage gpG-like protein